MSNLETLKFRSDPGVLFSQHAMAPGAISNFEAIRSKVVDSVVERTMNDFSPAQYEMLLGESLFSERRRIYKQKNATLEYLFIRKRIKADEKLWKKVQQGLLKSVVESDRKKLMRDAVTHYADEIGGHFSPKVYNFTTRTLPLAFNWLLNAASLKRIAPWKQVEMLDTRLRVYGEIEHLQRLSQKGTILLVPTHQSNIDSVLIGYIIHLMQLPPFAYGAGLNLFTNPVISYFMSNLGAYTVDRQKNSPLYKSVLKNYSTEILKRGVHSIFFPAGGRVRSGAIETHVKLGLLGTALQAQIENYQENKPNPNVYIVPMTTGYHFVLEASSLIDEYLEQSGKHKFMATDGDEPLILWKFLKFFWKLFSQDSSVQVRIGRPLDVFGNFVDENGRSIGPNGTTIDPKSWLTSGGELKADTQRDQQYIVGLGKKIGERYHRENIVLTSHLCAYSYFRMLRKTYRELDLYRFLRLSLSQRTVLFSDFLAEAVSCYKLVRHAANRGELFLSEELRVLKLEDWIQDGLRQLGMFHESKVMRKQDQTLYTEDMNLLYYYRNRLTGYGFDPLGRDENKLLGEFDEKGFLV
ncbi:MAG: 1-acyl-sn-glycerol-3-phosphate acyltransferase [Xanthomonadaceae bacterium]|nr:1-acyl-sn-glycerol-3-phosphate acyltransferase [Xanthomonadaceae bacterium]